MTSLATVDRRVLGAFRIVDAFSREPVSQPPVVRNAVLDVRRNASGVFVVFGAPGLRNLTVQFDPVKPWPAATAFPVTIVADGRRYLSRRARISMPRRPEPMSDPASSMIPQDVALYPAAAAVLGFNWAVVRVRVSKAGAASSDPGLPWAVLRMTRNSDGSEVAVGLCDRRGEGVLAVPGAGQSTNGGPGAAVITATFDATVTAYFDPGNANQNDQWIPDPDDVLGNLSNAALKKGTTTEPVKVGRGTLSDITIPIAV
jgi:hypothetical protein